MEHQSVAAYDFSIQRRIKKSETIVFNPVADPFRYRWNNHIFNIQVTKSLRGKSVLELVSASIWIIINYEELQGRIRISELKISMKATNVLRNNMSSKDSNIHLTDSIAIISFLHIPLHL